MRVDNFVAFFESGKTSIKLINLYEQGLHTDNLTNKTRVHLFQFMSEKLPKWSHSFHAVDALGYSSLHGTTSDFLSIPN